MGGDGLNNDGARGISSQDCKTGCGNNREEGIRQGMGVVLGECGIGDHGSLENKGVREEAEGKISEYAAGRPIYKLYTGAERMEGSSWVLRCWEQ